VAAQLTVKSSPAAKSWAEILGCNQRDFGRNLVLRSSLGYEFSKKRNFNELAGVVIYLKECWVSFRVYLKDRHIGVKVVSRTKAIPQILGRTG
jgi:hypothetical protein